MLDGVDDKWNSIENASYAYYSHIGSGSYLLNLIALNENGDEICRRKVIVHVVPVPWAQPWLVFGFYPLLTIVLFYVGMANIKVHESKQGADKNVSPCNVSRRSMRL